MTYDLVIRSLRVVTGTVERPAAVAVRSGKIVRIAGYDERLPAHVDEDIGERALLPGLVDSHVHVNEPGRTDWEGFPAATAAATAGGVTAIIDMPLNSRPPTLTTAALAEKRLAAAGACHVDVGFWAGIVPSNLGRLRELHDAGVFGFKCFTCCSGAPEFPSLSSSQLRSAFAEVASFGGLVLVHAEDEAALSEPQGGGYVAFLASRPISAETQAVQRVVTEAAKTGVRAHIVHLSAAGCLPILAAQHPAPPHRPMVTAETCPHYLTFADTDIREAGVGDAARPPVAPATWFKCCPPIREAPHREALWKGLADGVISCVVSDHSPCAPELKQGDFATAWGGISSLQLSLPAVWTAARARGHRLVDVVSWMAAGPAALAGLPGKGRIAEGFDADLVSFADEERFVVTPDRLRHRHPVTPYLGRDLTGVVHATWLRGNRVYSGPAGSASPAAEGAGRLLSRAD
ncbi:MAG TPA: allantoinase AllB [Streptosporangiaceae bacterium]|nr:allantoinase AllB [Streptosporangiaceae bacterium]